MRVIVLFRVHLSAIRARVSTGRVVNDAFAQVIIFAVNGMGKIGCVVCFGAKIKSTARICGVYILCVGLMWLLKCKFDCVCTLALAGAHFVCGYRSSAVVKY